ncbi:dienelactone hydrolase family protein [Chryseolinea lacunae]|uniref:Dienelactone hydrolase family protein n=1 Tax=Chryseolinea lacunae TaxID=2801331 RepID=A0ABS1KQI1_9BACT|nr:dienelactone hydrolase family protein [Chryseolinea lacunae]MBL0741619.1 dienelactone hydrolase family protein [Chryseolinea lacunae]
MRKIYLLLFFVLLAARAFSQDGITVCHTSSTDKFAVFASNKKFNREHPTPRPYTHVSVEGGKMIQYKTPDGQDANAYLVLNKTKTDNWIFVFQEWWGLNDHIKKEADELFKDLGNGNVIALDMYDGKATADRTLAGQYMQQFKQERGDAIVKGAIAYAGPKAKIGTIGWCFGGGQSLVATLNAGKQAVACVIYYGMPVDDVEKLKTLNTDVLGIFASREKYITPEIVKKFEANMKAAGKNLTVKNYDADHGFANPSNPIFDKAATEDAYKTTLAFFKARLK